MMKFNRFLLLAVLIIVGQTTLTIQHIRNTPTGDAGHVYSSLRGGKYLYISLTGHDTTNANNNKIELYDSQGTIIPCTVEAEGLLASSLTCTIGDSNSLSDIGPLSVRVTKVNNPGMNEVAEYTTKSVYMQSSKTPYLNEIFSAAGFYKEGAFLYLYGTHRISDVGDGRLDMGDIREIGLTGTTSSASTYNLNEASGDNALAQVCTILDVEQDLYDKNYLKCRLSSYTAGHYFVLLDMAGYGYSQHQAGMQRSTFEPKDYHEYTVLPVIHSAFMSTKSMASASTNGASNSFSANGNIIGLLGYGFDGINATDNVLKIDNTTCNY